MADRPPARRYRTVFMGTPTFAVPTLERLLAGHEVVGVFTQPDRPAGRGRQLQSSPVKELALAHGVPVFQPASLRRDPAAVASLARLAPDVVVVAAYGLILPPSVLAIAPGQALNVHASLLPRWRGAAPVAYAILAGDLETGVTIMKMDEGLDTGPLIAQRSVPVAAQETAGELTDRLACMGADLLAEMLPRWLAGEVEPDPQDDAAATHAPRLTRADGHLTWSESATDLARRVRALCPWPGAFTALAGLTIKVHAATALPAPVGVSGLAPGAESGLPRDASGRALATASGPPSAAEPSLPSGAAAGSVPGTVVGLESGIAVATGDGWLRLDRVQPAGGRAMSGAEFARGRPHIVGALLDAPRGG